MLEKQRCWRNPLKRKQSSESTWSQFSSLCSNCRWRHFEFGTKTITVLSQKNLSWMIPTFWWSSQSLDRGQYFKKVTPRPSFLRHTQRSKIQKLGLFWGPQKSEKFNFSKCTNKSVDHKFKSFAINWPQISI